MTHPVFVELSIECLESIEHSVQFTWNFNFLTLSEFFVLSVLKFMHYSLFIVLGGNCAMFTDCWVRSCLSDFIVSVMQLNISFWRFRNSAALISVCIVVLLSECCKDQTITRVTGKRLLLHLMLFLYFLWICIGLWFRVLAITKSVICPDLSGKEFGQWLLPRIMFLSYIIFMILQLSLSTSLTSFSDGFTPVRLAVLLARGRRWI